MAELDTTNLINFSSDEMQQNAPVPANNEGTFPYLDTQISNAAFRYSFDNNPFDRALRQVTLLDDPFESVFQEAEGYSSKTPELEVETGQLLSISGDERTLSGDNKRTQDALIVPTFSRTMSIRSTESGGISSISSINSLQCSSSNLDSVFDVTANSADKPSKLNTAFVDGVNENETILESSEIADSSSGILNKGFVNHTDSDRMQKSVSLNDSGWGNSSPKEFSTQNSSPNTSVKRHRVKKEQYNLLKLSLTNNSSPLLSGSDGSESFGESLRKEASSIAVELSKVDPNKSTKNESCEDLMSIKPPNWADSEGDLDSDLELLKIPMLDQIQKKEKLPQIAVEQAAEEGAASQDTVRVKIRKSFDLAALKERIQQEKLKTLSSDVEGIIANLRKIVLDCSNEEKKAEANNLLETLSSVLTDKAQEEPVTLIPPQPIIRQGTFDIDKPIPKEVNYNSPTQDNEQSMQSQEDETCSPNIQMTVPDIVEQIGKLFGNDNFNVVQTNLSGSSTGSNPTYIVVMGTPAMPSRNSASIHNTEGDGSPELMSSQIRRRSHSLSLVDKGRLLKRDASEKKTPLPIGSARRNSFSSTLKGSGLHNVRRSIYGPISKNTDPAYTNQKMLQPTPEIKVPGVPFKHVNPELIQKKLRTTSNESVPKNRGPLKATVPLKRMAPMIVTTSVSSPIDEKQKLKPITSTPIVLTSKAKGFPNACSTPTLQVSPVKGAGKNRPRYSYLSTTPNPKGRISAHQRRRSLTEIKSPRKGLETVKEIAAEKFQVKSNKLSRLAPVKARRSQKRESVVDNKENNFPRAAT